jgi:hypothetical protein
MNNPVNREKDRCPEGLITGIPDTVYPEKDPELRYKME